MFGSLSTERSFLLVPQRIGSERFNGDNLLLVKGGNSGKDLSFEELKGGTSSGGDVAHVLGASRKLSGGDRVSSSDDGDSSLLLGQVSKNVDNSESSGGELFEFEDSHGSVHDDGLALGKGLLLFFGGLGSVVKSHPSVRDGISGNNLGLGILVELVGDDNVGRKKDGLSELLGLGHDFLGGLNVVVLNERGTNSKTLGLQEGEDHTSSNDDGVALVQKSLKDSDLSGNLGSSNNGGHGLLSVGDSSVKVFEFLAQQESSDGRLQELGDSLGRSVSTVGGTEGIVDVKVERSGKLLNESSLVLGLFLVESGVLKHDNISLTSGIDNLLDLVTDAVGGESDLLSKKLSHALGARGERELVLGSILRASQVRADRDDGSLSLQVFDSGDGGSDTGVVGDGLSVKRNVNITSDQNLLSLKVGLGKILNGFLSLEFEDRRSSSSDAKGVCCIQRQKVRNMGISTKTKRIRQANAFVGSRNLRAGAKALVEAAAARRRAAVRANFILDI